MSTGSSDGADIRVEARPEVVGVVLAGGASRRMGSDKARLEVAGSSLVAAAARRLAAVTGEVVLADAGRRLVPGLTSLEDGPGAGPAAGILAAAGHRPGRALVVLACDLPQVPTALLERLIAERGGDAVVPRWERGVEPLCALYRPSALELLAARVEAGSLALHRWLGELAVRYLEAGELGRFAPPEEIFLNLNRPQDLRRLRPSAPPPATRSLV